MFGSLSKDDGGQSHNIGKKVRGRGRGDWSMGPLEYEFQEGRDFCVFH